jgi:hypothetical protein
MPKTKPDGLKALIETVREKWERLSKAINDGSPLPPEGDPVVNYRTPPTT